jgi:hypothetical protein
MKIFDHAERVLKAIGLLVSAGALIALITLNTSDAEDLRRFSIYALGEAVPDLVALVAIWFIAGLALRSKGFRALVKRPLESLRTQDGGIDLRNSVTTLLCLAVALSLVVHAFFLVRARAYFWRFLLEKSYVEGTIARVDKLGNAGRVQDAYALATQAQRVLKDEADQSRITNRVLDLAARVEGSRGLSQRYRRPDPLVWNPITQRIYYFANAEALRLNPQNYQAAEVLRNLYDRVDTEMSSDIDRLCDDATTSARLQTVSVLEYETFRSTTHGDCRSAARVLVNGIWQPEAVKTILAQSRQVRERAS